LVWHRLYLEAYVPPGTSLSVWARAADPGAANMIAASDQATVIACILAAPPATSMLGPTSVGVPAGGSLAAALAIAPLHRQPPLVASPLVSELPFHPGLAAREGMPGALYELLLQRSAGANRRLTGGSLDLAIVATGDGRHSPCLRAVRIYTPRFCYQDEYLPALFHQPDVSDESDLDVTVSPPDFRERLLASLEGVLTPIEGRAANAELLLDPYAAPLSALPWLGSFLSRTVDPSWPEARQRRSLGEAGRLLTMRATYRGVCLALDIATDGAVARGEVVLIETHRLRRTNATILGVPMSGRNVLTQDGVPSGNSIVGDTLVLSDERAIDVLALLAPSVAQGADAAEVARFLDEYAERVQVAALVHGDAALVPAVTAVLRQELPAQLNFEVIFSERSFVLGLAPLLGIDTYLEPRDAPAALRLDGSVLGRDTVIRDPAALRQ
jgi:phage tail-like protein